MNTRQKSKILVQTGMEVNNSGNVGRGQQNLEENRGNLDQNTFPLFKEF